MRVSIARPRFNVRLVALSSAVVFASLASSAVASADSVNLLSNATFANGTAGWKVQNAALSIASDGVSDAAAGRVAKSGTASSYQLYAAPKPVTSTAAGATYTAGGMVRSDTAGKSVCLQLKEVTSGGALVAAAAPRCVVTTGSWTSFLQESITAKNDGDQIAFLVRRPSGAVAGESFEVDDLSLTASASDGTAPTVPSGVTATAVSPNEIDVSWDASSDPDFGGVAGYAVYRDGSPTAVGTTSSTTYQDAAVGPGETHTYTVKAYDAAKNFSGASDPTQPVTTPAGSQPNVVGHWALDETTGTTAIDDSGSGNNGTISSTGVAIGLAGWQGTAYGFTHGSVIVPNTGSLVPGTSDIQISYWANLTQPPPAPSDYDMVVKGSSTSTGGQIKLEIQQNGQASCMFRGSLGKRQIQGGANLADGVWHHVVCIRSGNQIIEQVDGTTVATVTQATGAITVTDPLRFGSHENNFDWYNGRLDEVTYTLG